MRRRARAALLGAVFGAVRGCLAYLVDLPPKTLPLWAPDTLSAGPHRPAPARHTIYPGPAMSWGMPKRSTHKDANHPVPTYPM